MPKKLHTVTHPDGTVSTRRSDNEYLFAVVEFTSAHQHAVRHQATVEAYEKYLADAESSGRLEDQVPRYKKRLAELAAETVPGDTYFVRRWSMTRKAADAAARQFGARVVPVDGTV